jgi:TonB family protein
MRNPRFVNAVYFGALLAAFIAGGSGKARAQDQSSKIDTSDPKALLREAIRVNTLTGADMKPWHLKATVTALDENGNVTDEGTVEEFWAGNHKSKEIFHGRVFVQTIYSTEKGTFRTGSSVNPPNVLPRARNEFLSPVTMQDQMIGRWTFNREQRAGSGTPLTCLTVTGLSTSDGFSKIDGPTYCLETSDLSFRSTTYTNSQYEVDRSNLQRFQGVFVPGDIAISSKGKPILKAHLDLIETMNPVDDALLVPPPDAVSAPLVVNISGGVSQAMLLQKVAPSYPEEAKAAGIKGTVVLQARIGKDGRISDLKVISGAPELQEASIEAVRQWVYRPYLLNGELVEVNTTINVVFMLGR